MQITNLSPILILALGLPAAAEAEPVRVAVSADRSAGSTRILLAHSRPVSYAVQAGRGRITLRYAEPVAIEPPEMRFDDPILERYDSREGRTLVLQLGPGYERHETFELHNPYRVVLDLQGAARRTRTAARVAPRAIIVIDPGHGGAEQGAVGSAGLKEKDVTLLLARELRQALQMIDPAIGVVLTRDEDKLVGLDERTAVANHNKADLFVSIHLNASPRADASGAETYYLSTEATDDEARILAALENRSTAGESGAATEPKKDRLDLVLWDLAQNEHLAESAALAEAIQRRLGELTGARDRGVRQAPFRVLMGATMPAVLVEVGFVSNKEEELKLQQPDYRSQVVDALIDALREFLLHLRRFEAPAAAGRPAGLP